MAARTFAKTMHYRLEAAIAYVLYWLFRLLPVDLASRCGGSIARWFGPWSRSHVTAKRNLARALPDLTDEDRHTVLLDVWDNFGRVMAEYATLSRLWRSDVSSRVEVCGIEHLKQLADNNAPAIIFSGHLANWEVTALAIGWTVKPPAMVYRAPNNPFIGGLLQSARGPATATLIPKGSSGARDMIRVLNDGGFIAMAVDQKINTGLPIPLFGRDAMTGEAIARLALRSQCSIVPARTERLDGCRFKVTFEEPWTVQDSGSVDADVRATLVRINEKLEAWIREHPGQWLWLHNRWPKDEAPS